MEIRKQKYKPYYEKLGESHDDILRCQGCSRLVPARTLFKIGGCPKCGHRRMEEVRYLSLWEWFKIKAGFLRFENSGLFLEEFKYGK